MNISERIQSRGGWDAQVNPRHPILRRLHGKTFRVSVPPVINRTSDEYNYITDYLWAYGENPWEADSLILNNPPWPRLKLSRVLPRINRNFSYANLVKPGYEVELRISVDYKDILRCSETRHFHSCFRPAGAYKIVPVEYLRNPGVAIAYHRDKHGQFDARVFLYLMADNSILIGRPYGIIANKMSRIFAGMSEVYPNVSYPIETALGDRHFRWEYTTKIEWMFPQRFSYSDFPVEDGKVWIAHQLHPEIVPMWNSPRRGEQ